MVWTSLPTTLWLLTSSILASVEADTRPTVLPQNDVLDLPIFTPVLPEENGKVGVSPTEHEFTLRHIFHRGTYRHPKLHRRIDIRPGVRVFSDEAEADNRAANPRLRARSRSERIHRLADRSSEQVNALIDIGRMSGQPVRLPFAAWTMDDIPGPNISDKETVLSLSRIAANAYVTEPGTGEWEEVGGGFNYTEDFGWEADGLRGHIFADTENKTVIIGVKGTSPAVFDGSETTTNDKINDNLFFSCCCGQGGQYLWKQVCDCKTSAFKCNSTCVVTALREKNRYYYAAQDIYRNVTALYPDADIWVAGHSLGGAVSSLLGLTYGLPCVTFEAPAEAMAALRLGLPVPPGYNLTFHQQREFTGGYHFGQTADPIFMGTCNGAYSGCTLGGYAMESVCHTGKVCVYDTVADKGWRSGLGNHRIKNVIHDVIQAYNETPKCETYADCIDCFNWDYFESNGSDTTTSTRISTTSTTRTRTTTCKTPGWWGCLDETTTTKSTTTTSSVSVPRTTATTTCETPGWFGCKDPSSATSAVAGSTRLMPAPPVTSPVVRTSSAPTPTCRTPGWLGCKDIARSTASDSMIPLPSGSASATAVTPRTRCLSHHWWETCQEWDEGQVAGLKLEIR